MTSNRFRDLSVVMIMTLGLITALLLLRLRNSVPCVTGDASAGRPGAEKLLNSQEFGWIRQARSCDLGSVVVVTSPRDPRGVMVLSKRNPGRPLFAATANESALFDPEGKRGLRGMLAQHTTNETSNATVLFDADGAGDHLFVTPDAIDLTDVANHRVLLEVTHPASGPRTISYMSYDAARKAWIESIDVGMDGNLDLRMTEVPGRPKTIELRIGERWIERVDRDGRAGTILDGRWMSLADARAKLEPRPVGK
jgi:hypothetical protein